jgi:hypothetical protein
VVRSLSLRYRLECVRRAVSRWRSGTNADGAQQETIDGYPAKDQAHVALKTVRETLSNPDYASVSTDRVPHFGHQPISECLATDLPSHFLSVQQILL